MLKCTKVKANRRFHQTAFFHILLFIIPACTSESTRNPAYVLPTIEPRPDFILEVAPAESEVVPISEFRAMNDGNGPQAQFDIWDDIDAYANHVCLKVATGQLAQEGDDFRKDATLIERIKMAIDGQELEHVFVNPINLQMIDVADLDGNFIKRGVGSRAICGYAGIGIGTHEALFRFQQTSGNILEYRWQFALEE